MKETMRSPMYRPDLSPKRRKGIYAIVGEEPFQERELLRHFESLIENPQDREMILERWDGESLDGEALRSSLEMLPGLFANLRLVIVDRFDKISGAALTSIAPFLEAPSESVCLILLCARLDRRKGWAKAIEKVGEVLDVKEPYDRDWPKWHPYFESRLGRRIEPEAWFKILELSQRRLSLVWAELERVDVSLAATPGAPITLSIVESQFGSDRALDVFQFVEAVFLQNRSDAMRRYRALLAENESEVKLGALLVRQAKLIQHLKKLRAQGHPDPKTLAAQLGLPAFFLPRLDKQATRLTDHKIARSIEWLSEADYRLKTGGGSLFESFLLPFFSNN